MRNIIVFSICLFSFGYQSFANNGVKPPVVAQYSFTTSSLTASFTDASVGSINGWLWDFGDGNTSTQQNPNHTYFAYGTYTVCLTVYDSVSADSTCKSVALSCQPPTVNFGYTNTGFAYTFSDSTASTTPPITGWLWDFGDGNTSTQQNPTHTYSTNGTYTVCLTVTDGCATDSACKIITVYCQLPNINFGYTNTGFAYSFSDSTVSSSAPISGWLWDFGDGNISTQQNPTHTYPANGTYTVCLTVTNACGTDSICKQVTVLCQLPNINFGYTNTGFAYSFSDSTVSSSAPISGWLWDFGDGNISTQQNPTHTYPANGTYTVCLTVTNACGTDSICKQVTVLCQLPNINFDYINTGLVYSFSDSTVSSSAPISGWLWDFGDGNISTQQNPTHTYPANGTYTVCLTVTNACGTDSICKTISVLCVGPTANFGYSSVGLTTTFSDSSTSTGTITSWMWDFGDGNTSTMQNPSHTYIANGTYTVCLIVRDSCDSDTICKTITILSTGEIGNAISSLVSIYPNPSNGNVSIDLGTQRMECRIIIRNILGQIVYDKIAVNSEIIKVNFSDAGIYFITFEIDDEVFTRKVIRK